MGVPQNHAVRTTSMRCFVSRRYTLTAAKAIPSADEKIAVAKKAGIKSHSSPQSGAYCSTTRNITMTMAWKNKNTPDVPTAAKQRISRGKETFFTSPALSTMVPVAI